MGVVLYHRTGDPDSAAVRQRIVELGPKPRVNFENVDTEGAEAFAEHGGRRVPALWDRVLLHQGRAAVLTQIDRFAEGS